MNMKQRKQIDWQKFQDFKTVIAKRILQQLPDDHGFSFDDVKSEVDGAFISIIKTYKPKENGNSLSLESYCWKYAYKIAFNSLLREYSRLKLSTPLFEDDEEDEEEQSYCDRLDKLFFKKAAVQERPESTIDCMQNSEEKQILEDLAKEDPVFYPIYDLLVNGVSEKKSATLGVKKRTGLTEREVAAKLGMSQFMVHTIIQNFIQNARETLKGTKQC